MVSHLLFYALPPLTYRVAAFEFRIDQNNSTERSNPMAKRLFWLGANAVQRIRRWAQCRSVIDTRIARGMSGQFSSLFANVNAVVPQVISNLSMSGEF